MAKFNIYLVLLPDSMQCFCWDGWSTFALRELAVDTLTIAWRWASVSLFFFYSSQQCHYDIVFAFLTNEFFNWCMQQNIRDLTLTSFHFGFVWPENTEDLFNFKAMLRVQVKLSQWIHFQNFGLPQKIILILSKFI